MRERPPAASAMTREGGIANRSNRYRPDGGAPGFGLETTHS